MRPQGKKRTGTRVAGHQKCAVCREENKPPARARELARVRAEVLEEAASVCDRLAEMREQGAGEYPRGQRLRQAARMIRAGRAPGTKGAGNGWSPEEVTASWERLRQKVPDLPPTRFLRCDRCEQVRPEAEIDHHSPSGINHCKSGCAPGTKEEDGT